MIPLSMVLDAQARGRFKHARKHTDETQMLLIRADSFQLILIFVILNTGHLQITADCSFCEGIRLCYHKPWGLKKEKIQEYIKLRTRPTGGFK